MDISGCTNIEHIYFDGTAIAGLTLPNGGIIKTLHLPGTVTNLTIRNQPGITDFSMPGYSNITTLRLENTSEAIPAKTILTGMKAGSRVRLFDFDWTFENSNDIVALYDALDTMRGMDENGNNTDKPQVSGILRVDAITENDLAAIQGRYTDVTVIYGEVRNFIVKFWNGDVLMQVVENVEAGTTVNYTGVTPVIQGVSDTENYSHIGWYPLTHNVQSDINAQAVFKNKTIVPLALLDKTYVGEYTNDEVETVGAYSFSNMKEMTALNLPKVTYAGERFVDSCPALATIDLAEVVEVGNFAFAYNQGLKEIRAPKLEKLGSYAFYKTSVELVDIRGATLGYELSGVPNLTTLILRNDLMVVTGPNLNDTVIAAGEGFIYVPSKMLSSYASHSDWSAYASQLRAIEDYPDITGG